MKKIKEPLLVAKDDYDTILSYLRQGYVRPGFSRHDADMLETELRRAQVLARENLPDDMVRLNSEVQVKEESSGKVLELTVVAPDKADIKSRRISILSPIGTALLGFRQGQKVKWQVPAGLKTFRILEVRNVVAKEAV